MLRHSPAVNWPTGIPPIAPYDIGNKWNTLIDEVRARFSGQLFFALPYTNNVDDAPDFLSKVDGIYVEMSTGLSASNSPTLEELKLRTSAILDSAVYNLYAVYQKPIIIALTTLPWMEVPPTV